ncbi:MAG TPA: hypothetical protein VMR74_08460 [Gammaproteobacteria bacterium]|nr:hypothetical protein [Gammaproteobacteria bacterium]
MLWIAGSLSVVVAVYLGALYWMRASKANQGAAKWGLGALLIVLVVMGVQLWLTDLLASVLGLPYFVQVWIACVIWFVVTLIAGIKTDEVFERKLPVSR